jgi:hypothetical protein
MRPLLYFILILLINACTQFQNGTVTGRHKDSLQIGKQNYYFDSISEDYFSSVKEYNSQNKLDTGIVSIYSDSIIINSNSRKVCFRNDTVEGESMVTYGLVSIISDPGYVHIKGTHWEWTTDHYINIRTGMVTEFWDSPILSPNKDRLLAYSSDIDAGFMPNGIQLFKISPDTIIKLFEKEIDAWGPDKVKWESDTSVIIKRFKLDKNMQSHYDYLRLLIK